MILDHVESYRDMIELTLDGWKSRNPRIFVERVYQEVLLDSPDEEIDELDGSLTVAIMIENDTDLLDEEIVDKWANGIGRLELIKVMVKAGIPAAAANAIQFDITEMGSSGSDLIARFEAPDVADYVRNMFQRSPITDTHRTAGRRLANYYGMRNLDDKSEIMRKLLMSIRAHSMVNYKHLLIAEHIYAATEWPELQTIIKSKKASLG